MCDGYIADSCQTGRMAVQQIMLEMLAQFTNSGPGLTRSNSIITRQNGICQVSQLFEEWPAMTRLDKPASRKNCCLNLFAIEGFESVHRYLYFCTCIPYLHRLGSYSAIWLRGCSLRTRLFVVTTSTSILNFYLRALRDH